MKGWFHLRLLARNGLLASGMFGLDPKALLGGDLSAFTDQLQNAASSGQFDPMAMFTGDNRLHSVFLAPLTPAVQNAIEEFLKTGSGPFAGVLQQVQEQDPSIDHSTAQERARQVVSNAQGFCVILLENDQGLSPSPHIFFGNMSDEFIISLSESCSAFKLDAQVKRQLEQLRDKISQSPLNMQDYFISNEYTQAEEYWLDIGERLCHGLDEGIIPAARDQLSDLGFWVATNMRASIDELDGDELLIHARCACLAGELDMCIQDIDSILEDYEPDEEDMIPLCEQTGQLAVARGKGLLLEQCFEKHAQEIRELFNQSYEMALLRFRLLASSAADEALLMPAAQRLFDCDAKSCRHDLNKEPVWVISTKPDGTIFDTADAAEFLDRSPQFIGKRLDQGTLPYYSEDDECFIPKSALQAWLKIMTKLKLLD